MKFTPRRLFISILAVAVLTACSKDPANQNTTTNANIATPPGDEAKLNSGPQKEYPKLTMEAQTKIMAQIEEERRKKRVEGLRDKTPPADWIALAYHGLILDANFDPIELNPDTVAKIQESMFSILQEQAREKMVSRYGKDFIELFNQDKLRGPDRQMVRHIVLHGLLKESEEKLRERYQWRHRLLRGTLAEATGKLALSDAVRALLGGNSLVTATSTEALNGHDPTYVQRCRSNSVPIPPDWPDPKWISQGPLGLVFISQSLNAEVFAYKDPSVPGVCYALPRRNNAGSYILLGIICQSQTNGRACFWDNKTTANVPITGNPISLDIDTIGNGSTLNENCTMCHRGENVFTIHPGTPLQLSASGAPGGPYNTSAAVWPNPLGQATWTNPGPLVMPAPPSGQSSCVACHQLPQTTFGGTNPYCGTIVASAAQFTMPPFGSKAGWPGSATPVNPSYAGHIGFLSGCP